MAETRDAGQLADARALLAESLTIDMHSHAGLTSDSVPLARSMREGGMKAIALAFSSDRPLQSTRDGRIVITREPEPGELYDHSRRAFERLRLLIKEQALAVVASAAELGAARIGAPAIIVSVEGGDFLAGSVARLDEAHADHRLRHLQLTHYRVNELGDIQTQAPVHGGLTAFGADVVRACNRLGIVVDVAHGTHDLVKQTAGVTTKPLVLSHGAIVPFPRSLSRPVSAEHARIVAETGGVIGIWPLTALFVSKNALVDGMKKMVDAVGIDHVGFGSDLLGIPSRAFRSYADLPDLAAEMLRHGFRRDEVLKILGHNYARVFAAAVT
jgi:membrane dipeptidase